MIVSFMIETGKANGIDPLKYLAYLPEHRPDADIKKTLENILWIFKGFIKSLTLLVINSYITPKPANKGFFIKL